MTAMDHLLGIKCGLCGVHLFKSPKTVPNPIVFCETCGAGGTYKEVVEEGKSLTPAFVTLAQVDQMLRDMGSARK